MCVLHWANFNLIFGTILTAKVFYPQDLQFARNYDKEPIVIIAASHNSEGNNLKPTHMSVTAWIEVLKVAVVV